jgi:hypothetical protein
MNENYGHISYNTELWDIFLTTVINQIKSADIHVDKKHELLGEIDLLRAIQSYRTYPTPEELFRDVPELKSQEPYARLLWTHFDSLTEEELSDLAIQVTHKVSVFI